MENKNTGALTMNAQYIKDMSFENPRAPYSLIANEQPEFGIDVGVSAANIHEDIFEVAIKVNIKGDSKEGKVLILELEYAGLFTIDADSDDSTKEITLLVHCANILFPYARRIISDVTRDAGYPPLMLSPIDFMGLYRQRRQEGDEVAN